ncbi:MAG: HAD family hydrolase, partial [Caulobacteraceae bacterium]
AALEALDCRAEDTVMIGDTSFDMLMAKAAGMHAVGVTWGFHTRSEIQAGGVDVMAESFAELNTELDRFGAMIG